LLNNRRGITALELFIAIAFIAVCAAVILPQIARSARTAAEKAHYDERKRIDGQLEVFRFKNSLYPSVMSNDAWTTRETNWDAYFPLGVPVTCNKGVLWEINRKGRLSKGQHPKHE